MANTEFDIPELEEELMQIERNVDIALENVPDGPDQMNDLFYWSIRLHNRIKRWREVYANLVLAEALEAEEGE